VPCLERAPYRRREQHQHALCLPLVPGGDEPAGNARAETVETKPFFRDSFKRARTRCLIPVSGYYEWQDTPTGKQPWCFTARDGSPALTTAGLWDEWRDKATG